MDMKTLEEPVDTSIIEQLEDLDEAYMRLAERNAWLDLEKVQTLAAINRVSEDRTKLFESILVERGLSPSTKISINPKTRIISIVES